MHFQQREFSFHKIFSIYPCRVVEILLLYERKPGVFFWQIKPPPPQKMTLYPRSLQGEWKRKIYPLRKMSVKLLQTKVSKHTATTEKFWLPLSFLSLLNPPNPPLSLAGSYLSNPRPPPSLSRPLNISGGLTISNQTLDLHYHYSSL